MPSDDRASLAEGIIWDYEPDFMPEGMEKDLSKQDLADLMAYLANPGGPRKAPGR